jgi:hypothetical protein
MELEEEALAYWRGQSMPPMVVSHTARISRSVVWALICRDAPIVRNSMMSRIIFFMAAKVRIKEHNTKKKRFFLLLSSESTSGSVKSTKNFPFKQIKSFISFSLT